MAARRLTLLLTSPPSSSRFSLAVSLAEAAAKSGAEVNVFVMGDAAYGIPGDALQKLADLGVQVVACRHNAESKGVEKASFGKVKSGSQYDFSYMVKDCDVLLKL